MHPDIHLQLHHLKSAALRREAAVRPPSTPVRVQLGWKLVEWGLMLAVTPGRPSSEAYTVAA
ncbi:hypothetical protein [Streptomyces sp. NBC_01216]|uniref:hypothetical protein n=1 Tax=unclassified Streptomyces TaxID=2593676 RepID=UPI002E14F342|nr:hypothetical protein OG393_20425 [Streptomyces sp. NBC_01216]